MKSTSYVGMVVLLSGTLWAAQESTHSVIAKPWQVLLGTWKEIPGPDTPALIKVEPEGDHIKFSTGCKQDGSCPEVIVANYDGKPYRELGNTNWEANYRKTSERVIQEEGYLNGKLSRTGTWQLSQDGNTLTRTYHPVSPPGSKDITYVHDRSGGPVSKDDPFIGFWKYNWNKSKPTIITYTDRGDVFTFTAPDGGTSERNCDGTDHFEEAFTRGFSYSCQFLDIHTYELTIKQGGKVIGGVTRKVSNDGNHMVQTRRDAEGKITMESYLEKIK